jgi:hypothetical protein
MLSEIVRTAIEAQPDMAILYEARTLDELEGPSRRLRPDVIVVAAESGGLPPECARLMYEWPHPRTLSISPDGRTSSMWRLLPQGVATENVSTAELVEAIRDLGRPVPSPER